jgi:hypothetical protein
VDDVNVRALAQRFGRLEGATAELLFEASPSLRPGIGGRQECVVGVVCQLRQRIRRRRAEAGQA